MDGLLRLLPGPQPLIVRYGFTIVLVLLMFALKLGLRSGTGLYGFILYVPAVVAAALLFDRGSGYLAVAFSSALVASTLPWSAEQSADHVSALSSFILISSGLVLVSESLRRALERAEAAKIANQILLQEMSHRVKNKFTMIQSVIGLQARVASPETKTALEAISGRVRIIAQVHDYLQLSRHDGGMGMEEYLGKLCGSLADALGHLRPISVIVKVDPFEMAPHRALSVGLIVNELVTNAFKYAFPEDRHGTIFVALVRQENDTLALTVSDDGVGEAEGSRAGLGTRLVEVLAAQIGGKCSRAPAHPGTSITVTFKNDG
jgi:two-component sensor histidine kinase